MSRLESTLYCLGNSQYTTIYHQSSVIKSEKNVLPRGPVRVLFGEEAPLKESPIFLFAIDDRSKVRSNGATVVERAMVPTPGLGL